MVFTDATLTAIAGTCPAGPAELARISGVGARKLERYGDDVLSILGGGEILSRSLKIILLQRSWRNPTWRQRPDSDEMF